MVLLEEIFGKMPFNLNKDYSYFISPENKHSFYRKVADKDAFMDVIRNIKENSDIQSIVSNSQHRPLKIKIL